MTIEQLEDKLPNGFHDSLLLYLRADYERRVCVVGLEVALEQSAGRLDLILNGLSYCLVESPDSSYPFTSGPVRLSGDKTTDAVFPAFVALRSRSQKGSFFYSFFVKSWNSFIHLAALDADLVWLSDGDGKIR